MLFLCILFTVYKKQHLEHYITSKLLPLILDFHLLDYKNTKVTQVYFVLTFMMYDEW